MAHTLPARRVGMFGGAFDPPHWAHRALAETALRQLGLDVLHILPTGHAWHKSRVLSSAEDRVAMCELAFGDLPKVQLEYPQAQLFLVLGADQLLAFRNWVRWQEVLDLATLAVANRATNIGADAPLDQATETDLSGVDLPFEPLHMPLKNISATAVRARVGRHTRSQDALDVLVPEPVARYISQHHLYQPPT